jgi:hypothetical protein
MSEDNTTPEAPEAPATPAAVEADTNALVETAKPESADAYIEERREQEAAEETGKPVKRASRYERLKRARDEYRAEAEELRSILGKKLEPQVPDEQHQEPDSAHDEVDIGRREAETADQMTALEQQVRLKVQLEQGANEVRQHFPDFDETINFARDCGYDPGPTFTNLLMRHRQGPLYAYALAKDAANGGDILMQLEALADDPVAQAREFGKMEQTFKQAMAQGQAQPQQQRVTQAPPPMRPISGGSGAPKDIHSLASRSDDVSDYVSARRRQDG